MFDYIITVDSEREKSDYGYKIKYSIEKRESIPLLNKFQKAYFVLGSIGLIIFILFSIFVYWLFLIFILPTIPFLIISICLVYEKAHLKNRCKTISKWGQSDGFVVSA